MALGLKALGGLASLQLVDRAGLRRPIERTVYGASKNGFRAASAAGRTFTAAKRLAGPARQRPATGTGRFDLTPTDEQQMLQEAFGDFAAQRLRPAAQDADAGCAAPAELLAQANELGAAMLGIPDALGGVMEERSAVTSVLVAERLAHGDMGLAVAALAPAAVGTAISLYGDADQQATYLPPFVSDDVPVGALAILEPRALFDPFALRTTARRTADGFVLDGVKSLVPRAAEGELYVVAAALEGAPALFIVEAGAAGLLTEPDSAMGIRAAATGRLVLQDVAVPAGALLGGGEADVYADCIRRSRLAWAALTAGTARAVLDYVIPWVNERVAFGEPVSHRQAVAFTVSDIAIETEGLRLAVLRAAARADLGLDVARETAIARQLAATHGMEIGSRGVGLLGGHGYIKEDPVERWYRDLRAAGVMEGALLV
jgi:alkylation response protein AidB-like acyl-CoA dehydrogenase